MPSDAPAPAQFAEATRPAPASDPIDGFVDRLGTELNAPIDGWIGQIEALIADAKDLNEVADRLYALYPELSKAEFAQAMGEALVASSIAGRWEASQ